MPQPDTEGGEEGRRRGFQNACNATANLAELERLGVAMAPAPASRPLPPPRRIGSGATYAVAG
jgi:hypothetical protein